MINLPIPNYVHRLVNNYLSFHNIAQRGRFDGDFENQFTGLLGEVMVYEYLFKTTPELKEGNDGGIDMVYKGTSIDVKTMRRNVLAKPEYVNNFLALQMNTKCDVLIFNSYCEPLNTLQICGWIFKKELLERGQLIKKGEFRYRTNGTKFQVLEDTIEIQNSNLRIMRPIS